MSTADLESFRRLMETEIGADGVSDDVSGRSIDGVSPRLAVTPGDLSQLGRLMAAASAGGLAVAPRGGGTRTELGNPLNRLDVVVDTSRMNRVIEHNPADLTVTVEAGATVAGLQARLAGHGQFLALDPPLPDDATVGGTLATGSGGPLKLQFGNPRDLVIGMKVVQASGKVMASGGQVVKNVSGYDMARLHVGGLGTLGVIAEVSFKLTPLPQAETTLVAAFETAGGAVDAGAAVFRGQFVPMALTAFDSQANERGRLVGLDGGGFLAIRCGGRPRTVQRQIEEGRATCLQNRASQVEVIAPEEAPSFWRKVADFGWGIGTRAATVARCSLLPGRVSQVVEGLASTDDLTPGVVSHPGHGSVLVCWFDGDGGAASTDSARVAVETARAAVREAGGQMTVERCPLPLKERLDVWGDVGDTFAIMRRMKEQYDPQGVINPGRFVGGL